MDFFIRLFKIRNWSSWKHVEYVNDYSNYTHYELLKRTDRNSGETQYKRVKVSAHVHQLSDVLNNNNAKDI